MEHKKVFFVHSSIVRFFEFGIRNFSSEVTEVGTEAFDVAKQTKNTFCLNNFFLSNSILRINVECKPMK